MEDYTYNQYWSLLTKCAVLRSDHLQTAQVPDICSHTYVN